MHKPLLLLILYYHHLLIINSKNEKNKHFKRLKLRAFLATHEARRLNELYRMKCGTEAVFAELR